VTTQLVHETTTWGTRQFPIVLLLNDFDIKLNIGSIFRLADAFGVEHIYLTGRSATPPSRKINKTARSADKHVPFSYAENALPVIDELKEKNYKIISLELTTDSIKLSDLQLHANDKICLVLGSENKGVDDSLLNSSLNVSTATGIALYQLVQKYI